MEAKTKLRMCADAVERGGTGKTSGMAMRLITLQRQLFVGAAPLEC